MQPSWIFKKARVRPEKLLASTVADLVKKKGPSAVQRVRLETLREGLCVQVLHVGPYDKVGMSYEQLYAFAVERGWNVTGPAHEIYLNDPRRTAPANLKTVVRLGVKGRRGGK